MSDPYESVAKGRLKLKSDGGIKKKKKKNKDKKILEQATKVAESETRSDNPPKRTKAELSFKKMQEKMVTIYDLRAKTTTTYITERILLQQTQKILEKASMTHKQRVEKFNQHLDSLTEHFDIPKVSWTK